MRLALLLTFLSASAFAQDKTVANLAFMAGHWVRIDSGSGRSEELWLPPAGGMMLGVNRAVGKEGSTSFEYLRLEPCEKGPKATVCLTAQPMGKEGTVFKLTRLEQKVAVFENPLHDFPQRITYRREKDTLIARIESSQKGAPEPVEWVWQLIHD